MSEIQTWRDQDERRYELSRDVAERVLSLLKQHLPVVAYDGGPPTTLVSTLYFDSPDRYYLERAKAGEISSIKVRAREYMPVSDDDERRVLDISPFCYLERKERIQTIRQKDRRRIDKSELAPIVERLLLIDDCQILSDELASRALVPALISMYERRVWGSESDLRITFDERIRYYRPRDRPYTGINAMQPSELGRPDALGPKRILEVKHAAKFALPPWLDELLAEIPEATGFSKFLDGMACLDRGRRSQSALTRPVYKLS